MPSLSAKVKSSMMNWPMETKDEDIGVGVKLGQCDDDAGLDDHLRQDRLSGQRRPIPD